MNGPDKCGHCGNILRSEHKGPCPKCGHDGKVITLKVLSAVSRSIVSNARLSTVKEYYENHPGVMLLGISITLGSSLVGLLLGGYAGAIIGSLLSLAYFLWGRPCRTHHKEIDRG